MKQYLVIGAGRFGTSLAKTLYNAGEDVFLIDSDPETIGQLADELDNVAVAEATDEQALKSIGLGAFDVVIIAIGSDLKASIMATLLAKESGVPCVISKASDRLHAQVLRKIGADQVISPESDMGKKLGRRLSSENILDYMELGEGFSIFNIEVPLKWVGKSALELDVRKTHNVTIIGRIAKDGSFTIPIDPKRSFEEGDVLVIGGEDNKLKALSKMPS